MKKVFFVFIALVFSSCSTKEYQYFGIEIADKVTHSYGAVLELAQRGPVENVILDGVITQTCAKKGCWMDVKVADDDTIMVRFKDYGFFVPKKGAEDLRTVMHGTAKMDTISVDLLRHYAEDAGETEDKIMQITEPRFVLEFIADGVLIEK
tara:strand:- start:153 stop:605 length:453 start_codon:yes stop_codon:yes gene_type:complete